MLLVDGGRATYVQLCMRRVIMTNNCDQKSGREQHEDDSQHRHQEGRGREGVNR